MPKIDLLNRLANTLVVGAIFCTLIYALMSLDAELTPPLIFGMALLGTVIPAWFILR